MKMKYHKRITIANLWTILPFFKHTLFDTFFAEAARETKGLNCKIRHSSLVTNKAEIE